MTNASGMYEKLLDEYGSEVAVRKYTSATAGYGISYLLRDGYAEVYRAAVDSFLRAERGKPLRLLEFGCGAGMNIIHLVPLLEGDGFAVERAYGTDFSERLIEAAKAEAIASLPPHLCEKMSFSVGRNESLSEDLAKSCGRHGIELFGSFDLIVGINTFRYCHRLGKENQCAADIRRLLRPGGVCIIIDMNSRFPAFRSRLRRSGRDPEECHLPTLADYAASFENTGFEIIRKENFCWIPHSAGRRLTLCCRLATPVLNFVARDRAMRSLVVARKPV